MLSAIQPSNRVTLGNYLGALRNWVKLQKDYRCFFFAVDLHAITSRQDPAELREQTYRMIATYLAAGLDPQSVTLFVQSHVAEHAELAWVLNCFGYIGELSRMTQFKDKSAKQGANIPVGLFTYPVLMAADILLYQTDLVPVGDDQKQHVELTRDLAIRLNNQTGPTSPNSTPLFKIPKPWIPPVGARIMSLQAPTSKMSKSDPDPNGAIYLTDSNDQILKKFKRAVTDSLNQIAYQPSEQPGVANLLSIQAAILGHTPEERVAAYTGKQYGHLKLETADSVISVVGPIRDEADRLMRDRNYLDQILEEGAEKARSIASATLARVYDRVGFIGRRKKEA